MNRKSQLLIVILIIFLLLTVAPALADGDVKVSLTAEKNELTIGDPVRLTLEVNYPTGYQAIFPNLEQSWGDFEVRSQSKVETIPNDKGMETARQTIEVTLFALGDFQTPPLTVAISGNNGQVREEAVSPISLTVTPVLAEGDETLLDIKPQAHLKAPPLWPWVLGGMVLAAAVTSGGWQLLRRRQARLSLIPAPVIDNRPAYQAAFDELDRIENLKLLEQNQYKEHYTLVTDCLRRYLERQYQIRAFDRTTSELKTTLARSVLLPDHARRFTTLFGESDLVKFAKVIPDFAIARHLTGCARELVDLTKPAPEVEAQLRRDPLDLNDRQ